jgi:hypothetical protein
MARTQPRAKASTSRPPSSKRRQRGNATPQQRALSREALRARRKFLRVFPGGFRDQTYLDWERSYKWDAHQRWEAELGQARFQTLIRDRKYEQIASAATRIKSRTNLLFSFEKMALRDAVKSAAGAKAFALALFEFLHGTAPLAQRFDAWIEAVGQLPRRQTRVLTWPLVTVFGFIAEPDTHFFLKPTVTREAARRYGVELPYASRPSGALYEELLAFVAKVRADIRDLRPRDMIDMQSFLWVQGSDEYPD